MHGDVQKTVLTSDLGRLIRLEGCLSGNVPDNKKGLGSLPPVCREIADLHPAKVVYGPGTFINTAVNQIRDRALEAGGPVAGAGAAGGRGRPAAVEAARRPARRAAPAGRGGGEGGAGEVRLGHPPAGAAGTGSAASPSINDPSFVSALVFDRTTGQSGVPKSRFAYLFPSKNAALVQIRLRPDLTDAEQQRAIDLIRTATAEKTFKPKGGAKYIVTGVPVVAAGLADAVRSAIFVLLGAALVLMAGTLALVFHARLRLLPLALALAAAALTFGALSLAGGDLTMASIAALPVLIGLAVDYAIQFQARFERGGGARRAASRPWPPSRAGGPTILTAGLATATGFLVLLLSPVPMVRGFGALLVVGIVIALACALCAGFAALTRFSRPRARSGRPARASPRLRGLREHPRVHAAREWLADRSWRTLGFSLARPRRVLAIGLAVAVVGLALGHADEP